MFWQQHLQSVGESPWSTESPPTLTQRNTVEKRKNLKNNAFPDFLRSYPLIFTERITTDTCIENI